MTEQDKRNTQIVRLMYTGDETERANIASDIVWHVPGHNPVSGEYHGFEEYTKLMPSRMAPLTRSVSRLAIRARLGTPRRLSAAWLPTR